MLVNFGDVPLQQVTLEDSRLRFLTAYIPPAKEPDARSEARQSGKGFTVDEVNYQSRLPAKLNNTYVLRSINYNNSDVLVAFRVVSTDIDGSAVILWKFLKKYPVPRLAQVR
jgi:hypothetical protein